MEIPMIIQAFKDSIKRTFIYQIWKKFEIIKWEYKGRPIPPPSGIKAKIIKEYARRFSTDILIETGTYEGDMVASMRDHFSQIFSIELSHDLYQKAKLRFAKYSHICILHGDSSEILPQILSSINKPCLFWLDAHYSGGITVRGDIDTPIISELKRILSHSIKNHVILIDDAREFTGLNDYPTIENLKDFIRQECPDCVFEVADDIIRIHK
jgi:hypothetical protein